MRAGRRIYDVELHEGAEMMRFFFTETLTEGILMPGSDYPDPESRFSESNDTVLSWEREGVSDQTLRKLVWDDAVRCFGEP